MKISFYLVLAFMCILTFPIYCQISPSVKSIEALLEEAKSNENKLEGIEIATKALKQSILLGSDSMVIQSRVTRAELYWSTAQFDNVRSERSILKELYRDSTKIVIQDAMIGSAFMAKGQYDRGLPYLENSTDWFLVSKDTMRGMVFLQNVAVTLTRQGKGNEAIPKYFQMKDYWEQKKDTFRLINTFFGLSEAYFNIKDFSNAHHYIAKSLKICNEIRSEDNCYYLYNQFARIFEEEEEFEKAVEYYNKVATFSAKNQHIQRELVALANLGNVHVLQGNFSDAKYKLLQVQKLWEKGEADNNILYGLAKNLSAVYLNDNDCGKAIPLLDTAYNTAILQQDSFNLHRIVYHLNKIHNCLGNDSLSDIYFDQYIEIADSLFNAKRSAISGDLARKDKYYQEHLQNLYENKRLELKNTNKTWILAGTIFGAVIFILLGWFWWQRRYKVQRFKADTRKKRITEVVSVNKDLKKQKKELESDPNNWQGFTFTVPKTNMLVAYTDLILITTKGCKDNYSQIYTHSNEKMDERKVTLKSYMTVIEYPFIIRVQDSYIVNLDFAKDVTTKGIVLKHPIESKNNDLIVTIPIGKKYKDSVFETFNRYEKTKK